MINLIELFPPPDSFTRQDGSPRFCYLTFLMRNDSFLPGALVYAFALRMLKTRGDLICMVTKDISVSARASLEFVFDQVLEVEEIYIPHQRRQERQDRPFLFTRFQALLTGEDGPFGLNYEKVVLADADVLPLGCYDHLFTLDAPAGILNESRSNCMEFDDTGRYITPPSVLETGKWNWHQVYEPWCPHGMKIPKQLTDRVKSDPTNMGVNSSLWVLSPSLSTYEDIFNHIKAPEVSSLISKEFNWPEMQFASLYWSGRWTNIDLRFSSFNGYPNLDVLCGTHFAGYKPWNFKEIGTITRFSRFPDYIKWHEVYKKMLDHYPKLRNFPKLSRLFTNIQNLQK